MLSTGATVSNEVNALCCSNPSSIPLFACTFEGGDLVAIHTLACAVREIYEEPCRLAEIDRFYDHIAATYPQSTEKEVFNVLTGARDLFKHPDPEENLDAEEGFGIS